MLAPPPGRTSRRSLPTTLVLAHGVVDAGHARVGCLVFAIHQDVAKDVYEPHRWLLRRPLRWGGWVALTAVAPHVELQAVQGHQRAGLIVLFGTRGVDEPQAGVPCAGGWKKLTRVSYHPGLLSGPCWQQQ